MNSTVRNLLVFSAGLVVGAFTGIVVTRERYERMAEEEIDEMRNSMRELLDKKKKELIKDAEGITEMSSTAEKTDKSEDKKETERVKRDKKNYNKVVDKLGYNKTAEGDDTDEEEEEEKEKFEKKSAAANKTGGDPHVISFDEFNDECDHYSKLTIFFYEDDEVLTDEDESIITDVARTVGEDTLDRFGEDSGDPEVVYARNDNTQIDYEIIRLSKSYAETVLGIRDDGRRR